MHLLFVQVHEPKELAVGTDLDVADAGFSDGLVSELVDGKGRFGVRRSVRGDSACAVGEIIRRVVEDNAQRRQVERRDQRTRARIGDVDASDALRSETRMATNHCRLKHEARHRMWRHSPRGAGYCMRLDGRGRPRVAPTGLSQCRSSRHQWIGRLTRDDARRHDLGIQVHVRAVIAGALNRVTNTGRRRHHELDARLVVAADDRRDVTIDLPEFDAIVADRGNRHAVASRPVGECGSYRSTGRVVHLHLDSSNPRFAQVEVSVDILVLEDQATDRRCARGDHVRTGHRQGHRRQRGDDHDERWEATDR